MNRRTNLTRPTATRVEPIRRGFTLVEMVMTLTSSSILMLGLSSAIYVALESSNAANTSASEILGGLEKLADICDEIHFAETVTEQGSQSVTFTVADRDADTSDETIRYSWTGVAGASLLREYNGGAAAAVVEDVHHFSVTYYQPHGEIEYVTLQLQLSNDSSCFVETTIDLLNRP